MAKYTVSVNVEYSIEVEAENTIDALEAATKIDVRDWNDNWFPYEIIPLEEKNKGKGYDFQIGPDDDRELGIITVKE
jgi:hypothetical protein